MRRALLYRAGGRVASKRRFIVSRNDQSHGWAEGRAIMRLGVVARGPLSRPGRESLPFNRGLPLAYRYLREARAEPAVEGPLGRDPRLAAVEAALFAADEPLTPRRLAQA